MPANGLRGGKLQAVFSAARRRNASLWAVSGSAPWLIAPSWDST